MLTAFSIQRESNKFIKLFENHSKKTAWEQPYDSAGHQDPQSVRL